MMAPSQECLDAVDGDAAPGGGGPEGVVEPVADAVHEVRVEDDCRDRDGQAAAGSSGKGHGMWEGQARRGSGGGQARWRCSYHPLTVPHVEDGVPQEKVDGDGDRPPEPPVLIDIGVHGRDAVALVQDAENLQPRRPEGHAEEACTRGGQGRTRSGSGGGVEAGRDGIDAAAS